MEGMRQWKSYVTPSAHTLITVTAVGRAHTRFGTLNKEWVSDYVGGKQGAQEAADALNYKFFECPQCDYVQVEEATVDEIKCDRCDHTYFPA